MKQERAADELVRAEQRVLEAQRRAVEESVYANEEAAHVRSMTIRHERVLATEAVELQHQRQHAVGEGRQATEMQREALASARESRMLRIRSEHNAETAQARIAQVESEVEKRVTDMARELTGKASKCSQDASGAQRLLHLSREE